MFLYFDFRGSDEEDTLVVTDDDDDVTIFCELVMLNDIPTSGLNFQEAIT